MVTGRMRSWRSSTDLSFESHCSNLNRFSSFIWCTVVVLWLSFTIRDSLHFSPSLGLPCSMFHDFLFLIYSVILVKNILQHLPEKGCIVKFLSFCIKMPSFFCHMFFLSLWLRFRFLDWKYFFFRIVKALFHHHLDSNIAGEVSETIQIPDP